MVELPAHDLDLVFHALSDRTRRAMVARLAEGERSIGDLAQPFAMSLAGASKHVKVLEEAGLVRRSVQGSTHICRLEAMRLAEADEWLRRYERFWSGSLDRLAAYAERKEQEAKESKR